MYASVPAEAAVPNPPRHLGAPVMAGFASAAELVRAQYDAYSRRDLAGIFAPFSPDVEICQSELLPWGGQYRGLDAAKQFFSKLVGHIDSQVEVEELVPAGERVIVLGRTRGTVRATGAAFDVAAMHVWTVRDGKITGVEFFVDTPAMLAALGAS